MKKNLSKEIKFIISVTLLALVGFYSVVILIPLLFQINVILIPAVIILGCLITYICYRIGQKIFNNNEEEEK